MQQLKQSLKSKKQKLINFKCTDEELAVIKAKAEKYANGNLSEWIRYAAIELEPRSKDLVKTAS